MGLFPEIDQNALFIDQTDPEELLGSFSPHPFFLDGREWPTVAHYFQAGKFDNEEPKNAIATAVTPKAARKLGRSRFRKPRKDWSGIKTTIMTRAVYTKMKTHAEARAALLATGDRLLVESNSYDYFWGCGRDRRGSNHYGQVLMKVRKKLREEGYES